MKNFIIVLSALIIAFSAPAFAQQERKIELKTLSTQEKDRYTDLLKDFGLLAPGEDLGVLEKFQAKPAGNPFCEFACNQAAAEAARRCGGNATCLDLVEVGRRYCLSRC